MIKCFVLLHPLFCFRHFIDNGLCGGIILQALLMAWVWETIQRLQFSTFQIKDMVSMASGDLMASFNSLFVRLQ